MAPAGSDAGEAPLVVSEKRQKKTLREWDGGSRNGHDAVVAGPRAPLIIIVVVVVGLVPIAPPLSASRQARYNSNGGAARGLAGGLAGEGGHELANWTATPPAAQLGNATGSDGGGDGKEALPLLCSAMRGGGR